MLNTAPQAAALWTALLLILMVVLSALVVRQRQTHRVGLGDGGKPSLQQASRAFGNAAEYIPAGIAAMILLSQLRSSFLLIHAIGLLLFVGRLVHGLAISGNGGVSAGRVIGMALTWTAYIVAAIALLLYAVA